ncbi:hypothetical protein CDAR_464171 [Caerostris darwini]|uniref:Uncharacterized protein n=1 Tax=Caerostris darwini TaxID=1538125 RepID=A0AAV4VUN8_9ARAC|nr:hypothetical protein CDAR_464171 [Caerostris darwini]
MYQICTSTVQICLNCNGTSSFILICIMSDSETGGDSTKRGRGRPKKSLEPRSESKDSGTDEPKAKRGRGRPKGTANKKAKKTASSGSSGGSSKRGRGRPKKSDAKDSKNSSDQGDSGDDKDD